jgi:hypothetical protein
MAMVVEISDCIMVVVFLFSICSLKVWFEVFLLLDRFTRVAIRLDDFLGGHFGGEMTLFCVYFLCVFMLKVLGVGVGCAISVT